MTHNGKDAPGWEDTEADATLGPVCWKCRGEKSVPRKLRNEGQLPTIIREECPICAGVGRMLKKRKVERSLANPGTVSKRQRKHPEGWVIPGPSAPGGVEPLAGEELCCLLGHWRIFQRPGGHRWSTDDLVTAYVAGEAWRDSVARSTPREPAACLDLGCGIGTVLMMVAWQFVGARCVGIEAQELSATMARRSIQYNGIASRCTVQRGDIRTFQHAGGEESKFDLVTGTPPYFPVIFDAKTGDAAPGVGGLPSCEQSAPARYEFRGGVEAYCHAAAPRLRDSSSRFVVCEGFLDTNHPRVLSSADEAGLVVLKQVNVVGRDDKVKPLFAVYVMALKPPASSAPAPAHTVETIIVRHKGGRRSEQYNNLMAKMGIAPSVEPAVELQATALSPS